MHVRPGSRCAAWTLASATTHVAAVIPNFIASEMVDMIEVIRRIGVFAMLRQRPAITVVNIKTVIHMAVKVRGAVKPRADADEDTAAELFRAVVAVGSTAIRSGVVLAVRAVGYGSDVDADVGLRFCGCRRGSHSNGGKRESTSESGHEWSSW
jgi:hypothetical protein